MTFSICRCKAIASQKLITFVISSPNLNIILKFRKLCKSDVLTYVTLYIRCAIFAAMI